MSDDLRPHSEVDSPAINWDHDEKPKLGDEFELWFEGPLNVRCIAHAEDGFIDFLILPGQVREVGPDDEYSKFSEPF